jgi:hypothetical protein
MALVVLNMGFAEQRQITAMMAASLFLEHVLVPQTPSLRAPMIRKTCAAALSMITTHVQMVTAALNMVSAGQRQTSAVLAASQTLDPALAVHTLKTLSTQMIRAVALYITTDNALVVPVALNTAIVEQQQDTVVLDASLGLEFATVATAVVAR